MKEIKSPKRRNLFLVYVTYQLLIDAAHRSPMIETESPKRRNLFRVDVTDRPLKRQTILLRTDAADHLRYITKHVNIDFHTILRDFS